MPAPRSSTVLASSLSASLSLHDSLMSILRSHVFTLFNLVIFLCALGILALGRWLVLLFAIAAVTNVIIGVVQEYSAKLKLDRIALLHQDRLVVRCNDAHVEDDSA